MDTNNVTKMGTRSGQSGRKAGGKQQLNTETILMHFRTASNLTSCEV